jgi:hypothetical protein
MKGLKELARTLTPQVVMLIGLALVLGLAAGYYFGYDIGYENAAQMSGN